MKRIRRLAAAPSGLAEYREVEGRTSDWEGFRSHWAGQAHRQLLDTLDTLQHGLCGYCETRLIETDRQVEHVIPRSDPVAGRRLALEASNLIACCKGGTKSGGNGERRADPMRWNRSCGEAKGATRDPAFLDPREVPALPSLTRVRPSGHLEVVRESCATAGLDPSRVERTIAILGLNVERLRRARRRRWVLLDRQWRPHRDDAEVMAEGARDALLTEDRLPRFFTTVRSFFGEAAETVLAESPEDWV